jgi:transcriptional regulator with XRE-family HTH domain
MVDEEITLTGAEAREKREALKISLRKIAPRVRIHYSTISLFERGIIELRPNDRERYAMVLRDASPPAA